MVRIFISRDEARRYDALAVDYRARGFSAEEWKMLYAERQQDETPYIADSRLHADIIVDMP